MPSYITGLNIVAKVTDGQVTQHIGEDLKIDVNPFSYEISGVKGYFGGEENVSIIDGYTNYIFLNSDGYLDGDTIGYPSIAHIRLSRVETLDSEISLIIDDRAFFSASSSEPVPGPHANTHKKDGIDSLDVEEFGTSGAKGRVPMSDGNSGIVMNFPFGATTISVGAHSEYTTIKSGLAAAAAMYPSAMNPIVVLVSPGFYVEDNSSGPLELFDYVHINGTGYQKSVVVMPAVDTNYLFRSSLNGYGSLNCIMLYGCDGVGGGAILNDRGSFCAYFSITFVACATGIKNSGLGTNCALSTAQFDSCANCVVADNGCIFYGVGIFAQNIYGNFVTNSSGFTSITTFTAQAFPGVGAKGLFIDGYGQSEFHNGKFIGFNNTCDLYDLSTTRFEVVRIQDGDGYDIVINDATSIFLSSSSEFSEGLIYNPYGAPVLGSWRDPSDNIMKISGSMDFVGGPDTWLSISKMTNAQQASMVVGWEETEQGRTWFNTTKNKFVYWNGHSLKYITPEQVITVGKEGADYTSISAALNGITDASLSKPYTILVNAGIYMESPFLLKQYVSLQALGVGSCVIWAVSSSSPLITMVNSTELNGFTIIGPMSSQAVFVNNVNQIAVSSCQFQLSNTAIKVTGSSAELYVDNCRFVTAGVPISYACLAENNGKIFIKNCNIEATNALKANGGIIEAQVLKIISATNAIYSDNGGEIEFQTIDVDDCSYVVRSGATGVNSIKGIGLAPQNTTIYDIYQEIESGDIVINNSEIDERKISISNWDNVFLTYYTQGEANSYRFTSDLRVGIAELGNKTLLGEGGCHNRGMYIFTTDDTASSSSDGGTLTDVSDSLRYIDGYTATFQGVGDGYSILIGSSLSNDTDNLKHWGLNIIQTTASVENIKRSFIFEIWDGSAWVEINVMALDIFNYYKYSNEVFLRADSGEGVFYGLNSNSVWEKKSISGHNLYWSRIRIKNTLVSLPEFNQIRMMSSGGYFGENGYFMFSGTSRFKRNFCNLANYFGDEGGIATANINIGSGGVPTGWPHMIPRSLMNGNGDAIQYQFTLPRGIDTGMPLSIRMNYSVVNAGSGNATFIASILPIEVQGILEADPSGGVVPVARTLANTETIISKSAQTVTNAAVPNSVINKLQSITFNGFSVANYYEGDIVAVRVEMDNRAGSQIAIWDLDVLGTLCALGENQ